MLGIDEPEPERPLDCDGEGMLGELRPELPEDPPPELDELELEEDDDGELGAPEGIDELED